MIEHMNHISQHWWDWMFSMFWQAGVLIVLVALIDLVIRKWVWPQLRYALWLLVLVKLVLPPSLNSPTSLTSNLQPLAKEALAAQMQKTQPTEVADSTLNLTPVFVLENESGTVPIPLVVQAPPISVPLVVGESPIPANSDILPAEKENLSAESITVAAVEESTTQEAPTVAPKVKLHGKFYVMLVWTLGIWILTGWFILHWRQLTRQVRNPSTTDTLPDWFFDSLRETAELLGLRRIPKVAVSSKIATPAVFVLFRPTLLMPTANLDKLSRRDGRHVLLHELAHIKRRDPLVHSFNLLLQIVYWFNPLLWLVRRQIQHLRELCCDATVAKILKENTMAYRETLFETAKRLLAKPVEPGLGLLGLFEDSNRLLVRLRWLEKKTWKHSRLRLGAILMAMAFMGACILPMAAIENPQPSMLLSGIVTDADTGNPIAGAIVSDDGYGPNPNRQGVTDVNGNYQYLTWPEEHNIVVQADGYKSQHKVLTTSFLQNEQEKGLSFTLTGNRAGSESPPLPPEPTEQDEQAIRKLVNQFWWAIRTNNAKALEKMIEPNTEDRNLVDQFLELAGQDFQVNEKSSKSKAESIPIILQTRKTSRNRFQALVLLPGKDGFRWRSLHVSKTGSQYYLNLGIKQRIEQILQAQMMSPVQIGRKEMAKQRERWRKADAEELKTLIQEKIRESEAMIGAGEYAREHNIIIVPNVPIEQSRETLNTLKTTPPEQLRKQILEEKGKLGWGGYGGGRGGYSTFRRGYDGGSGYGYDEPGGFVKQKKLIQLEAQILRVPTMLISSLGSDQKTEKKDEVPRLLLDMEKGEVVTSLLDAAQIDFLIKSLRSSKETQLISMPRVFINTGETAELFSGQRLPHSKFDQGFSMRVRPTMDDQDRIRLDIQLSQQAPRSTDEAEYATGFYENQVTLQARLQSGQSLLAALPEDFLTDFHTKKSSPPTQILMVLTAKQKAIDTRVRTATSTQSAQNILTDTLVSIEFQEMPLSETLNHLAKYYDLNLSILWGSLETKAGITRDDAVTLMLKQVPLQKALESILAYVSSGKPAPAKYMVDQGVITIATDEDLQGRFQVQTMPLSVQTPPGRVSIPPAFQPSSSYPGDRPWKWYVLMEEIRTLQQKKLDMDTQIRQIMIQRQQVLKTKSKDHPDIKAVDQKINLCRDQYVIAQQKYDEASMQIRDLEEKIMQSQQVSNQLRFLQQQQQKLEQRILDTRIEYESATSVQEQKRAEILLPALEKQQDILEAKIHHQQEQLEAIHRQMN